MEEKSLSSNPGFVIRRLRRERGITQAELCGEEIARNLLSQIETGKVNPSLKTMQYLAKRLDVPMSLFFLSDAQRSALTEQTVIPQMIVALEEGKPELCLSHLATLDKPGSRARALGAEAQYRLAYAAFSEGRVGGAREWLSAISKADLNQSLSACVEELNQRIFLLLSEHAGDELYYGNPLTEQAGRWLIDFVKQCVTNQTTQGIAEAILAMEHEDRSAKYLSLSMLYEARGMNAECRNAQINIRDRNLSPDTALWYYRKAEECCARMNDFESAYKFSKKRAALLEQIKANKDDAEKRNEG